MFEKKMNEWAKKVIEVYQSGGAANTYQMMIDIDNIIAEAFDHYPMLEENLKKDYK